MPGQNSSGFLEEINYYISLYNMLEKGILPDGGAYLDQNIQYYKYMNIINGAVNNGK
jgi:hypothetical protein